MSGEPIPPAAVCERTPWLAPVALALATLAAYANSLHGPFVYDDIPSIVSNPSIRHLWPLREVLMPSLDGAVTTAGRPVLNFSFALSYALSGTNPWGHHAINLLIHIASTLALFGLVRLTLARIESRSPTRDGNWRDSLALGTAALWAVHPLQTQAVTYTVQRAESLMGLFYLLTLYAFARATVCRPTDDEDVSCSPSTWLVISVVACALGMATKEVMVTAPLMTLLYDRAFVGGSFRAAWSARRGYYLALGATWLLLAALVLSTGGNRGGSIGLGVGVSWWSYALTQFEAVARYLALSVWPHPLVFEYGTFWTHRWTDVLPGALIILPLVAGTIFALRKFPRVGFAGAWFLGILAPTSLSPGTTQMIVEHRMYLPLAAVIVGLGLGARAWLGARMALLGVGAALACVALTSARNHDYRSAIALWSDALAKRPDNNVRAHENLAEALVSAGRVADGIVHYRVAAQLAPKNPKPRYNLGRALLLSGHPQEAIAAFEAALGLAPDDALAHTNLALALDATGQPEPALTHATRAAQLVPANPEIHYNHALLLRRVGRLAEATTEYEAALKQRPDYAEAHNNLGNAYLELGRLPEAIAEYETTLRLRPASAEAHDNLIVASLKLGRARAAAGQPRDAIAPYERALALNPKNASAHYDLANARLALGELPAAIAHYEEAVRLKPDFVDAHVNLATALARSGRATDALEQFEQAVRLAPDDVGARIELANLLTQQGRLADAIVHYERALQLRPDLAAVREQLARLRAALATPRP